MPFILGIIVGVALLGLVLWLQRKEFVIKWYEWLLAALGLVLLIWTVNDFFVSMSEHNEAAARVFLWLLGTPAIVLLGLAIFLPWWRYFKEAREVKS